MRSPPRLWRALTEEWCPIHPNLARAWWFAVSRAGWSQATGWRDEFMTFVRRDAWTPGEDVEAFFGTIATPQKLIDLTEWLMHEKVLVRRDGHQLQEQILRHVAKDGVWKHQQGRRQTA